ncbi:MAG: winged helix-turn-helix domain-containing protein [Faecalibacillus sp.]
MALKYDIKVRVYHDEPSLGKGVVMLLELVDQYGSLSKAYKDMNMAASKAWKILNRAQKDLGIKLIESTSGGKNGGSSFVTKEGKDYIRRYHLFVDEIEKTANKAFMKYFGDENE